MMEAAQDGRLSLEETLEDAITQRRGAVGLALGIDLDRLDWRREPRKTARKIVRINRIYGALAALGGAAVAFVDGAYKKGGQCFSGSSLISRIRRHALRLTSSRPPRRSARLVTTAFMCAEAFVFVATDIWHGKPASPARRLSWSR